MKHILAIIGKALIRICPDSDWCSPASEVSWRYRVGSFLIGRYGK
jgi:hypothetical protein